MVLATGGTIKEIAPNAGVKVLLVTLPTTFVGGTDTYEVDLTAYGCTKASAIFATSQTTAGTVLVAATAAITGISSGVATITTSATGTNVYGVVIYAY